MKDYWEAALIAVCLAVILIVSRIQIPAEPVQPPCLTKLSLHTSIKGIPCS